MTQVTHIILLSNSTVLECYELIKALILFHQYYIPVRSSSSQSKGVTLTGDLQAPCSLAVFVGAGLLQIKSDHKSVGLLS